VEVSAFQVCLPIVTPLHVCYIVFAVLLCFRPLLVSLRVSCRLAQIEIPYSGLVGTRRAQTMLRRKSAIVSWLLVALGSISISAQEVSGSGSQADGGQDRGRCSGPSDLALSVGCVHGFTNNGINKWLGVPFAAAPTGGLRFQAPQAATRSARTINATRPGNCCWGAVRPA